MQDGRHTDGKSPVPQILHGMEIVCRLLPNETSPGTIAGSSKLFPRHLVSPLIALCRSAVSNIAGIQIVREFAGAPELACDRID